ncbi:MAG: hypothetical protein H6577_08355 [Lewinellaceae bacterium]|nr:hypothetical protein [Saprospiraceae bacterium]MCB9338127.1 hypothetical protein [Lewinellaceae bacterium]
MKQAVIPISLCLAILVLPAVCFSQKIDLPETFKELLNKAGIEFFEPLEAGYKDIEPWPNPYQPCNFAIRSRKEDLQIRYLIEPWKDGDPLSTNPHVAIFRTLTNLATNADDALVSAIQPTGENLRRDFNADWGMVYFFQPKKGFSDKPFCRMVALYKEGKGMAYIFYLFDDPGNEALDIRYLALRFQ